MELLYTTLLYIIQPLVWLRLLFRSFKAPAYRKRWAERYGYCRNKVSPNGILLHSVSVGETLALIPLVRTLRNLYPSLPITITTMTPTGSECVISAFGKDVHHVYLPYDLPCAMERFLNTVHPKLVIIMETELWPNMIDALYARKIPLVIANARLSVRSAKGYIKLGKFMHRLLFKLTLIAVQNEEDGARFISLGLRYNQLAVTGNLKFDISVMPELAERAITLRNQWAPRRQVWIATSTHDGEEAIILQAHRALLEKFPELLLILAPRHPERFSGTQEMVQKAGFNFMLRSSGEIPSGNTQVVIGDTIGELMLLYGIADLAFVGGSLVKHGGHNPLEPTAHAIPVLMGPHTFNFKEICTKLQQANGLITVTDAVSVAKEVSTLLINDEYRQWYGRNGFEVLYKNQGALTRLLHILRPYLAPVKPLISARRLSAVMIAQNAENLLPGCLASLDWVDEIVLLDSGSKDKTVELAKAAGVKVFIDTNWQGYGIQRQRAQRYATGDYVLMIDTDERLTPVLKQAIQSVLRSSQDSAVYSIARSNYFLGRFMRHSGWYPDQVLRLYSRKRYQYNDNLVHESLVCNGARIIPLQGELLHLACCDFASFQQKQLNYATAWAQELHQYGKKISLIGVFIKTISTFLKTLLLRGGILDGKQGWLLAVVNAQYTFNKYTTLWALNRGYSEEM